MACEQEIERAIASEGQVLLGWRDVPTDNRGLSERTQGRRARDPPGVRRRAARASSTSDALERKLYIIRKKSGHAIQALQPRHGKEFYVPSISTRTHRLQGDAARAPGRRVLPRPARRVDGVGAGHGAPALLDQHVPDVGPRASVPLHLPQRRDQHAARQLQLDPRARRRDRVARCWATTSTRSGR